VIVDTALEIQRSFNPDAFSIEENQFQHLLASIIGERAQRSRIDIPLYTLNNHVNKLVRIRRLTPFLAQRRIRFKVDSPGARLLVNQLREFPLGHHDDGPDALEMAIRLAADMLDQRQYARLPTHIPIGPEFW